MNMITGTEKEGEQIQEKKHLERPLPALGFFNDSHRGELN
jgi:hypothetical protein